MANEANIKVSPDKEENLHKIMEVTEAVLGRVKELAPVRDEVDEMRKVVERLQTRCDELDKQLPRGSKIYQAETPSKTEALREFGNCITAAWRSKHGMPIDDQYVRAAGNAGNNAGAADVGGVLVPQITYDKVARIIGEASIIRKIATIIPMTSNNMTMPTRSSGPSVTWLTTEGQTGGDTIKTSVVMGNPQLTSKTMMAIDEISSELDEDSIVALEPFFAQLFAEAVAQEENQKAFSSTSIFSGVANTSGIGSVNFASGNTFAEVKYNDLLNLMYAVDTKLAHKGTFILSAEAFKSVTGMLDSQNRPIWGTTWTSLPSVDNPPDRQSGIATVLLGRPCYITQALPSSPANSQVFAIYGDFSKFAFGDRKQMTIDWSDQVYFEYGNLALRVRERVAMKVLIASAFAILKTKA